jgi:iron complex transport system substrate-binding protein
MSRIRWLLPMALLLTSCASPITISGDTGDLILEDRPSRIVSLSATHTEILYAIGAGDLIAGTDLTSNYPPEARSTVKVDAFNFDVEEIVALQPDLVITAFDYQGELAALETVGVPALLLSPAATLDDAYGQMEVLGRVTGREEEAVALVASLQSRIEELTSTMPGEGFRIFHEVDNTLFSATSSTFLGDIYALFGFENIADEVPDEFGSGYVQVSEEYLFSADPDLIFLGDASFGESPATVAARPGWNTLNAVKSGRVFELDGDVAGRWGPRAVELVEDIAAALESGF